MKTLFLSIILYLLSAKNLAQINQDYRNSYCGVYSGVKIYGHIDNANHINYDTSLISINISKNVIDSIMDINVDNINISLKFVNGQLSPLDKSRYSGTLTGNEILLTHIPSMGPVSFKYIGKK